METLNIEALAVAALNRLVDTASVIMDGLAERLALFGDFMLRVNVLKRNGSGDLV